MSELSPTSTKPSHDGLPHGPLATLVIGALGVVYGDIGTSPLYALKTAYDWAGSRAPDVAMGLFSLIVWTLIVTTSIKYVAIVMRADNHGEGGILALMARVGMTRADGRGGRPAIVALGILGAALLYGDGAITPAISVLSALEGLKLPIPSMAPTVLPLAAAILVGLFVFQRRGTAAIGRVFGPVMILWFAMIGILGLIAVWQQPSVLRALDPRWGIAYLGTYGRHGFTVLGAVFLSATGAEALYADMGHFGARPIRFGWYGLVLPALLLNYAGQTALVLQGKAGADTNPFFLLGAPWMQLPLVALATVATIIASQSIISGVFSMTRQAVQLGLCPRLTITQTSAEGYGQIYVSAVNWVLMLFTLALTLGFGSSDRLAAANRTDSAGAERRPRLRHALGWNVLPDRPALRLHGTAGHSACPRWPDARWRRLRHDEHHVFPVAGNGGGRAPRTGGSADPAPVRLDAPQCRRCHRVFPDPAQPHRRTRSADRDVADRTTPPVEAAYFAASKARFSSSTFTRGSPNVPHCRPTVWASTSACTCSSVNPRARATRAT